MSVLIVTYDLDRESNSSDYEGIIAIIKEEKNWAKLSESCYAMDTSRSPQHLFEKIKPLLDGGDRLLIFTAGSPYFGQHSKEVIAWLGKKL